MRLTWNEKRSPAIWNALACGTIFPENERSEAIGAVSAGGSPLDTIRQDGWFADGEDLAEGEVEQFLKEMTPALAAIGVDLNVETIGGPYDPDTGGYAVSINGTVVDLHRLDSSDPGQPVGTDDPWTDCMLKPLAVVNRLLEQAGRRERVAVFYPGGNDGIAYLLPLEAIKVMQESPSVKPRDRPAAP